MTVIESREEVLDGLRFPEGNRWHDGELWFSDMHTGEVFRMKPGKDNEPRVIATLEGQSSGMGWLPSGDLIVSSMLDRKIYQVSTGGDITVFADLSSISTAPINDLVIDDVSGVAYVGGFGYDLYAGEEAQPGPLYRIDPDGGIELAADGFVFPNAAVILPGTRTLIVPETWGHRLTAFDIADGGELSGRRTWAELDSKTTPDGTCVDMQGGVWLASLESGEFQRVVEGGEVTDRVPVLGRCAQDCVLGGEDGRTLYLSTADSYDPTVTARTKDGKLECVRVTVPGPL